MKIQGVTGYNELSTALERHRRRGRSSFLNPDVEASTTAATTSRSGSKLEGASERCAPKQTTLTVLNGNGVAGSASNASYLLGQKGYKTCSRRSGSRPTRRTGTTSTRRSTTTRRRPARQGRRRRSSRSSSAAPTSSRCRANLAPLSNGALLMVVVGSTFHDHARAGRRSADARSASRRTSAATAAETRSTLLEAPQNGCRSGSRCRRCSSAARTSTRPRRDARRGSTSLGGQPTRPARLPHRRERVLGHPDDATGRTRRSLADKSLTQRLGGRRFDLYYYGPAPAHGRAARRTARPTGS